MSGCIPKGSRLRAKGHLDYILPGQWFQNQTIILSWLYGIPKELLQTIPWSPLCVSFLYLQTLVAYFKAPWVRSTWTAKDLE